MQVTLCRSLIAIYLSFFVISSAELQEASKQFIRYELFSSHDLPINQAVSDAMAALDYWEEELPFVYHIDLNQDGNDEIFLGSPEYRLCGTAGCPYFLVDGDRRELIGEFFGTLVLTENYVNNYPVIQAISRLDIEFTNLHTYVYDAGIYKIVSHAILGSKGMDEWTKDLR